MTKKQILKRLFYSLIIAVTATILYWIIFTPLIGCFPMSNKEKSLMALFNVGICVLTFISSLTALLNLRPTVKESTVKSFLAFLGLPLLLFVLSILLFVFGKTDRDTFFNFFEIGLPTTAFCLTLVYHFYKFRQSTLVDSKT